MLRNYLRIGVTHVNISFFFPFIIFCCACVSFIRVKLIHFTSFPSKGSRNEREGKEGEIKFNKTQSISSSSIFNMKGVNQLINKSTNALSYSSIPNNTQLFMQYSVADTRVAPRRAPPPPPPNDQLFLDFMQFWGKI